MHIIPFLAWILHDKPQVYFFIFTYSLLKPANGSTHGDGMWYAYVLHHLHDNYNNKQPQALLYSLRHLSSQNDFFHYATIVTLMEIETRVT